MKRKIRKQIAQQIRNMEQMAINYRLGDPKVSQILDCTSQEQVEPLTITISEDKSNERFPEKLDMITDLLDFLESYKDAEETAVVCSVYGEHMMNDKEELVYIQVKCGDKVTHHISKIKREKFRVDTNGRLCVDISLERFVNYQTD